LALQANFVPNPFANANYQGLCFSPSGVRLESAGLLNLATTPQGRFSGYILLNGKRHALAGQFNIAGQAVKVVQRPGTNALTIEMALDTDHGSDPLRGRVTDGNWSADLWADRAAFRVPANPAPFAGKYTLRIPLVREGSQIGQGIVTVSIDASGNVTMAGTLADGTKFTQGTRLSRTGRWPFYSALYRASGLIESWPAFPSPSARTFSGTGVWIRPPTPTHRYLRDGFTRQITLEGTSFDPTARWWIDNR
jgi:hypothetical protein